MVFGGKVSDRTFLSCLVVRDCTCPRQTSKISTFSSLSLLMSCSSPTRPVQRISASSILKVGTHGRRTNQISLSNGSMQVCVPETFRSDDVMVSAGKRALHMVTCHGAPGTTALPDFFLSDKVKKWERGDRAGELRVAAASARAVNADIDNTTKSNRFSTYLLTIRDMCGLGNGEEQNGRRSDHTRPRKTNIINKPFDSYYTCSRPVTIFHLCFTTLLLSLALSSAGRILEVVSILICQSTH
ncbi:hypothetical protein B0H19DRAFT_1101076 [Mycena capillaripes]|nr:hypothetical protein B0H19DRAFT_1101076 [Mycena capillaripes]